MESSIRYIGLQHMVRAKTQRIAIDLAAPGAVDKANEWVVNDVPSAAVLTCTANSPVCGEATQLLNAYRIPYAVESVTSPTDRLTLTYDRISERPCDVRAYGCPQASNALRMVDDPRRIVRPSTLDYPTAER